MALTSSYPTSYILTMQDQLTSEPKNKKDFKNHISMMKKHNCQISIHGHDHRIMHYKDNTLTETGFKKIGLNNDINIIFCPPVSNGTYPNGVTILDTKKKQIEFIPLNTPVHVKPEWRKL